MTLQQPAMLGNRAGANYSLGDSAFFGQINREDIDAIPAKGHIFLIARYRRTSGTDLTASTPSAAPAVVMTIGRDVSECPHGVPSAVIRRVRDYGPLHRRPVVPSGPRPASAGLLPACRRPPLSLVPAAAGDDMASLPIGGNVSRLCRSLSRDQHAITGDDIFALRRVARHQQRQRCGVTLENDLARSGPSGAGAPAVRVLPDLSIESPERLGGVARNKCHRPPRSGAVIRH